MAINYDLGAVTAYGIAIENGYEGTAQDWIDELTSTTQNALEAKEAAEFVRNRTFGAVIRDHGVQIDEREVIPDTLTERAEAAATRAEQAATRAEAAGSLVVDNTLTQSGQPGDAKVIGDELSDLNTRMNALEYKPITINSFTINPSTVEIGSAVTSISYSYGLSKTPATLSIDNVAISNPTSSGNNLSFSGFSYNSNHTFVLRATDVGPNQTAGANVSRNATLTFLYRIYWGTCLEPDAYNDDFLTGDGASGKTLTQDRLQAAWFKTQDRSNNYQEFSLNVGDNQYIYFALPSSYYANVGSPVFNVRGFEGGFEQVASFTHTNKSGGTAVYTVWKSVEHSLGEILLKIM